MSLNQILSAILAGGLAGQITTLFLNNIYSRKREISKWLRSERFKTFSELMSLVSVMASREDLETRPENIRDLSVRVHLLFEKGTAPDDISKAMQTLFLLALHKKLGRVKDEKKWRHKIRDTSRALRHSFARELHKT
jgi:hypothetical protein